METIDIDGKAVTKCETTRCEHNTGHAPPNGQEVRVCGFEAKSWIGGKKPIRDCSNKAAVMNLLAEQGRSPHQFDDEEGVRVFDEMFYPPEDPEKDSG